MMNQILKAPENADGHLARFWSHYFSETPTCTSSGCEDVAVEVDPFFPYLDDLNRCFHHRVKMEQAKYAGSLS